MTQQNDSQDPQTSGDIIKGEVGNVGPGAQVGIGKGITQTSISITPQLSSEELAEVSRMFATLREQLAALDIPQSKKLTGQELASELEKELTKTDGAPDGNAIKFLGSWLLDNIPAMAGTITGIFASPIVGKLVEASGDLAKRWMKERFKT